METSALTPKVTCFVVGLPDSAELGEGALRGLFKQDFSGIADAHDMSTVVVIPPSNLVCRVSLSPNFESLTVRQSYVGAVAHRLRLHMQGNFALVTANQMKRFFCAWYSAPWQQIQYRGYVSVLLWRAIAATSGPADDVSFWSS